MARDPEMTEVEDWCRCEPELAPNQHLILDFFNEIIKYNILWYFQLFSPELPGLKIRYFQETSSNLPYLGTTKTLPRLHSKKHDFTQHVGFIIFYCHIGRPVSKISHNNKQQSVWWWVCEVAELLMHVMSFTGLLAPIVSTTSTTK